MTAQATADPGAGEPAPRRRRGLSRWPIRRKLVALVAVPLLVILAGGAYVTVGAVRDLRAAQDAEKITNAASLSNKLSQQLQTELIDTLTAITPGRNDAAGPRVALKREWQTTDAAYAALLDVLAAPPGGAWDFTTQKRVDAVRQQKAELTSLRQTTFPSGLVADVKPGQPATGSNVQPPTVSAPSTNAQPSTVVSQYGQVIDAPRQLTQRLGQRLASVAGGGATVNTAASIAALAEVSAYAAQEVTLTDRALIDGAANGATLDAIKDSQLRQSDLLALARVHATDAQQRLIDAVRLDDERIGTFRSAAFTALTKDNTEQRRLASTQEEPNFRNAAGQRLTNLDEAVAKIVTDGEADATEAARAALTRVGIVGGGALLVLLLVTAFTAGVARSVTVPLRRLRSAAVETANVRLPAAVQQIDREGPEAHVVMPPALPPGEAGGPETAEVARAVDGLTSEAVRLASAQVRLRRSLDDAFVSMSRRSQSMVEKQLAIIDELERTEEDPEQLRNLFRLDHLAARMRRYNDNLLVLAGSVVRTRSNAPVPIADVFRAATSEMEQYERVRLQPVSGAAVAGPAAGGLIHLLAELLDNAAMYSPPTSPILMAAAFAPDGSLRLEITDSGVGIPASELAELNMRLASPGSFDMQVPSRMGLYVVGRLAQRGKAAGTIAEVVVPSHLVIGGSGLVAEPPRTPTSLPQLGAGVTGRAPASPPRGVPAGAPVPAAGAPAAPPAVPPAAIPAAAAAAPDADTDRATAPVRRVPGGVPAAAERPAGLPQRVRGDVPPAPSTDRPAAARGAGLPFAEPAQAPAARGVTSPPATTPGVVAPVVTPSEASGSPLPSRRPGAALAGGPLAAAAGTGPATLPGAAVPGSSPFDAPAAVPAPVFGDTTPARGHTPADGDGASNGTANGAAGNGAGNGTSVAAARAGGFGAPGRPFTAGTPSPTGTGRRAAGAGAPSAATAAAAAAAARAARSGGSTP
ncbi:MAG TPA: ATP-binding protein, partial [Kineosporiaceae bacterium]|nr:ATP-binding protein [Kineosporiaceae bacterium]